jgi:thiamine biosynthesis lipoprotein
MAVAELRGRVMASAAHLVCVDSPLGVIEAGLVELERLEQRWSRFLPGSDISRLNALPRGGAAAVDDATMILVATMIEAWRATDGVFDPTVLPALVAAGYATSIDDRADRTVRSDRADGFDPMPVDAAPALGLGGVELDTSVGMVWMPVGVSLDPGGIGKGLAADLVVHQLLAGGAQGALVSVGGDLAMSGRPPQRDGWNIAIEHPDHAGEVLCQVMVDGGGVATSSTRSRRWMHRGREMHHLIDARTGQPAATDLASVTVFAGTAWQAEAHATAALASGRTRVLDLLACRGLQGVAVCLDGTVIASPALDMVTA